MRRLPFALVVVVAAVTAASPAAAADPPSGGEPAPPAGRLDAAPAGAGLRVHVRKRGLFAAFAHDHDFEVTRWRGRVELGGGAPGRATVTIIVAADSLRDREKGLSDRDRDKVNAQTAGPAVLDAAHSPEVVYRAEDVPVPAADAADPAAQPGTVLHGQLTLRGRIRPLDATCRAERDGDGWRVRGSARFRQSDFGIEPVTAAGGTVGVKDELEVTFDLTLSPGP